MSTDSVETSDKQESIESSIINHNESFKSISTSQSLTNGDSKLISSEVKADIKADAQNENGEKTIETEKEVNETSEETKDQTPNEAKDQISEEAKDQSPLDWLTGINGNRRKRNSDSKPKIENKKKIKKSLKELNGTIPEPIRTSRRLQGKALKVLTTTMSHI
jgi:uncharacterized membrane protein YdfJ with MMPL/SSD domain